MIPIEHEELVQQAQKGSDEAFLILFQQYERDLFRIAYVYVKNQEDALDVVQETAYRSFKSIRKLQQPSYFKTWLIRIAISCSIDLLRKRKQEIEAPGAIELIISAEDENLPLTLSLRDLIEELDVNEKSVIMLRFYHDYTIKEVTEMLDIPLGTGKTILYRALKKLRKLAGEGDMYAQSIKN